MADGHLHRATCEEVGDLSGVQSLIGVHKRADLLIERAMREWEGFVRCSAVHPGLTVGVAAALRPRRAAPPGRRAADRPGRT